MVEELHREADRILNKYNKNIKPLLANRKPVDIKLICSDFFTYNLREADVILLQCTCMGLEMVKKVQQEKLNQLKPGSLVITATEHLEPPFKIINSGRCQMGWGVVSIYFHQLLP